MQSTDLAVTLRLIDCIAACGVVLSSLEYLTTHSLLSDTGLLSWPVHRLHFRLLTHGTLAVVLNTSLAYPNVVVLLGIQSGLSILLLVGSLFGILPALAAFLLTSGIALTLLLFALRSSYGREGADQMFVIIFSALALTYAFNTTVIFTACLWFLAIQSCLSYATAGIAKITSPIWRSGQALPAIMATRGFGYYSFSVWLRKHPRFTKVLTWGTMGLEMLFPLALLGPQWLTLVWLLCGFGFHISNAILMRLNRFIWAFAATYPAIWYCASTIHLLR
ncbi:MAG TPA: hypothetical protein VKV40_11495 [Ktedonobacteraceae bacterium]|nr:hypothetical protein [Ktedonobacteraceae bacterium]